MANRDVRVAIIGDPSSLRRALAQSEASVRTFQQRLAGVGDRLRSVGSSLTRGLTLPMVGFGYVAYRELSESQRALAQTQAVVESMGIAAQVSVRDVQDLTTELRDLSGMDDEGIQQMLNTLLTFRNVVPIFDEAGQAALDLAAFFDGDLTQAATSVGRALNNPLRGMSALSRKGVEFDESQRQAIESMMAFGNVAGAQQVILRELTAEYGGQAEALGGTIQGRLNRVRQQFEDMAATVLEDLLPVLEDLAGVVESVSEAYARLTPKQQKWVAALALGALVLGPVLSILGGLVTAASAVAGAFAAIGAALGVTAGAVALTVGLVAAAVAGLVYLAMHWQEVREAAAVYVRFITDKMPFLKTDVAILRNLIQGIGAAWRGVTGFARQAFDWITRVGTIDLAGIVGFINSLTGGLDRALSAAQSLYERLVGINNLDKQAGGVIAKPGGRSFIPPPGGRSAPGGESMTRADIREGMREALRQQPVMVMGSV